MEGTPENHKEDKPKKPVGARNKWDEGMVEEAYLYCLEHHGTDRDLANYLGISHSTFYSYEEQHPEFLDAIKRGRKQWRQNGCGSVVRSAYRMAEMQIVRLPKVRVKKVLVKDPETGVSTMTTVERTVTMEQHVCWPNQRSVEFILINQDPENWRLRPETNVPEDAIAFAAEIRQALKEFDDLHQPAPEE